MTYLYPILLVIFLIVAVFLVVFILLQQGKGASMGASFGAGASNTLFGAAGSGNFFTKSTWFLTFIFFALSIALGYLNAHKPTGNVEDFTKLAEDEPAVVQEENKAPAQIDIKNEPAPVVAPVAEQKVEEAKQAVEAKVEEVKATAEQKVEEAKQTVEAKVEDVKATTEQKVEEVKTETTEKVEEVKQAVETKVEEAAK